MIQFHKQVGHVKMAFFFILFYLVIVTYYDSAKLLPNQCPALCYVNTAAPAPHCWNHKKAGTKVVTLGPCWGLGESIWTKLYCARLPPCQTVKICSLLTHMLTDSPTHLLFGLWVNACTPAYMRIRGKVLRLNWWVRQAFGRARLNPFPVFTDRRSVHLHVAVRSSAFDCLCAFAVSLQDFFSKLYNQEFYSWTLQIFFASCVTLFFFLFLQTLCSNKPNSGFDAEGGRNNSIFLPFQQPEDRGGIANMQDYQNAFFTRRDVLWNLTLPLAALLSSEFLGRWMCQISVDIERGEGMISQRIIMGLTRRKYHTDLLSAQIRTDK